jgi:hypothetical protein
LASAAAVLLLAAGAVGPALRADGGPIGDLYGGLPEFLLQADHEDLSRELRPRARTLAQWRQALNADDFALLCLGESHTEESRSFFAAEAFSELRFDQLLLEESQSVVDAVIADARAGRPAALLGAPIDAILRATIAANPRARIDGIEATAEQALREQKEELELRRSRLSRDGFIGLNALAAIKPGTKAVALIGQLHCALSSESLGFAAPFFRLVQPAFAARGARLRNARAIHRADAPALFAVLERYGLWRGEAMALVDLRSLDPRAYGFRADFARWFESFDQLLLLP